MYHRPLFSLSKTDSKSKARLGKLLLPGGSVDTPVFMPVGTIGTVKTLSAGDMKAIGYNLILNNTFHLYLRPGLDVINSFQGIKKFINWDGYLLTDSGGFQVFSLADLTKITDAGAEFRSPIAGDKHFFTPEGVIDIQLAIGSDIIMPLDECTASTVEKTYAKIAKDRTTAWAKRSKTHHDKLENPPFLFGITQGNIFADLRKESLAELMDLDFDGYSIGGLSVGEGKEIMYELTDLSTEYLPREKARYLMGIGSPEDLVEAVSRGIDMFDCVMPTRNARNASVFTWKGKLNLINARHRNDPLPIDPNCRCEACRLYSRAYLRHMFKTKEMLAYRLSSLHNLTFLYDLMEAMRTAIKEERFSAFKKDFLDGYFSAGA